MSPLIFYLLTTTALLVLADAIHDVIREKRKLERQRSETNKSFNEQLDDYCKKMNEKE